MSDEITREHEAAIHALSRRVASFIKEEALALQVPTASKDSTALTVAGAAYAMIVVDRIMAAPQSEGRCRQAANYTMQGLIDAELTHARRA